VAPALAFEVASVRANTGSDGSIPFPPTPPDGIILINHPLESIIRYAHDVLPFQVTGMPQWANAERFDITAKATKPITEEQLGLKLTPQRRTVETLVIDSVERPAPD
jgi:uncharacterized protein (TIGR03435 family)